MKRDILFKEEDFVFSYRVSGILKHNNHILMQMPRGDDGYSFIGGHVDVMETASDAVRREFSEELHADITVDELFAIGEVFFPWGERPCHQISLYYLVHLNDDEAIPMSGRFPKVNDEDRESADLDFCWVSLDEIKSGVKIYPKELIPYILENRRGTVHFVSKQI